VSIARFVLERSTNEVAMSSRERVQEFYGEVLSGLRVAQDLGQQLHKMRAYFRTLEKAGNTTEMMQLTNQIRNVENQRKAAEEIVLARANRGSLGAVEDLLRQIEARLRSAEELQAELYRMETRFELMVSLNEFQHADEEGMTREKAEMALEIGRRRYDQQITLADQLVPNKAIQLMVTP
jgi:hypothetical protein